MVGGVNGFFSLTGIDFWFVNAELGKTMSPADFSFTPIGFSWILALTILPFQMLVVSSWLAMALMLLLHGMS